ncbi:hypothetical protein IMZ31_24365 (plasmid) [Pontibacillus sp. ALD_SL1]|uniref:hypothetical protein n=1 Tax=Pontibacillus sp. ALD_SL1 TaxID=2777185 RepID=UPI001A9713EA|nr:hypothetical protein [Pontibacillus sp. ALD_SL1]QST02588.1 hypothetical protein IMZ31_24365 [Pontibacillus sp. ALD_SL1]
MFKQAIRTSDGHHDIYMFQVLADSTTTLFQWYLADSKEEEGKALIGDADYPSYFVSDELIEMFDWEGKYLYCVYRNVCAEHGDVCTERILLHLSIEEMQEAGVLFDNISKIAP